MKRITRFGRRTRTIFADQWISLKEELRRVKNERDDLLALVEAYRKWARACPIKEK